MLIELDFNPYNLEIHPNGYLIAVDHIKGRLVLLNNELKQIEIIDKLDNKTFQPLGLTTNGDDRIYICDYENNSIIMTDLEFKYINSVGGRKPRGNPQQQQQQQIKLNLPYDVCYSNQFIYVCDFQNKRIQKLTANDLTFDSMYPLTYSPWQIKINQNLACIRAYDDLSINFYNLSNFQITRKYTGHNGIICQNNSLFFEYNHLGCTIECYDSTGGFCEQLVAKFTHIPFHSYFGMILFNGRLIISAQQRFIVLRIYEACESLRNQTIFNMTI